MSPTRRKNAAFCNRLTTLSESLGSGAGIWIAMSAFRPDGVWVHLEWTDRRERGPRSSVPTREDQLSPRARNMCLAQTRPRTPGATCKTVVVVVRVYGTPRESYFCALPGRKTSLVLYRPSCPGPHDRCTNVVFRLRELADRSYSASAQVSWRFQLLSSGASVRSVLGTRYERTRTKFWWASSPLAFKVS